MADSSFNIGGVEGQIAALNTQIATINGKDCMKLHYKEVTIPKETLGSSFSPTATTPGTCTNLFGINASNILSIHGKNGSLTPAANFAFGTFNDNLYIAATQSCTLSNSYTFVIIYFTLN